MFAECGADAQMDDVARRAGVGVGTVYRHFPTKEALMAEIVRQKFRIFAENARAALDHEGEPFAVFADLLRTNAEFCARDAGDPGGADGFGRVGLGVRPGRAPGALRPHRGADRRAQRAGTMRPDVTVNDIPMLMCGVSATMPHAGAGFDWHRHLEFVIDALRVQRAD